ncbi:hypothetical protein C8R47DRAFT_668209 [Mycena vitilis]|nr:hypothetical protein C8R47DRAFT_668209 [Mycena vitilis]
MPGPFLELLSIVLRRQTQSTYGQRHEPNLCGIFEITFGNTQAGPRRLLDPVDKISFDGATRIQVLDPADGVPRIWELRTLTLRGMWQAVNPNDSVPSVEALRTLHEQLVQDDEEVLLARPYSRWSPTLDAMETVSVSDFVEAEPEIPQFLAVGGARILMRRPS